MHAAALFSSCSRSQSFPFSSSSRSLSRPWPLRARRSRAATSGTRTTSRGARRCFSLHSKLANGNVKELVFSPGRKPSVNPGSSVRLRGEVRGNRIVVADGSTQVTGSGSTTVAAPATKRVAVVLFTFSNATTQPYTPAYAAGVAFTNSNSVAAYYAKSSWGQLGLTGDVYGWYSIGELRHELLVLDLGEPGEPGGSSGPRSTSAPTTTSSTASRRPRSAAGRGPRVHAREVLVAQRLGRDEPARHGARARTQLRHASRELAELHRERSSGPLSTHLLELHVERVRRPVFTVNGAATSTSHELPLGNFGWLPSAHTQTVTAAGDYTLSPLEAAPAASSRCGSNGRRALSDPRAPAPTTPFDTSRRPIPHERGRRPRHRAYTTRTMSQLVDATPGRQALATELAVGKTLIDPLTGVSITTLAVAPAGATVRVTIGGAPPPPLDTTAPSQPGSLQAAALDASRVSLSWIASTDNVGVTGYRILRNSTLVTTVTGTGWTDTGKSRRRRRTRTRWSRSMRPGTRARR